MNNQPKIQPIAIEVMVTITNQIGMIHSSFSFSMNTSSQCMAHGYCERNKGDIPGVKKKATFENRRAGVKRETFSLLIC